MAPASTPDKFPPTEAYYGATVDVIVGPASKVFKFHKEVLCFYSGFFARALNGEFQEAQEGIVTLPEEDEIVFGRFVKWMHTRKVDDIAQFNYSKILCDLWIFADRREMPMLMNACLDSFRETYLKAWSISAHTIDHVYENTAPSSKLRSLVIHILLHNWRNSHWVNLASWPKAALVDMLEMKRKMERSGLATKERLEEMDMCKFHEHEKGISCPKE